MSLVQKWKPTGTSPWNPFKEMDEMQERLACMIDLRFTRPDGGQEAPTTSEWWPRVDISENDQEYLFKAEVPEVKREDVTISSENGVLRISGERNGGKAVKNRKQHRIERSFRRFVRSFTLPDDGNPAKVFAECKDGVLKVHIPKVPPTRPKAAEIKVNYQRRPQA